MTYYIRIRGKAFGPFDEKQLLSMKDQRKLNRVSEVSQDKIVWQTASELKFLFPESEPQPQPEPQQQQQQPVQQPTRPTRPTPISVPLAANPNPKSSRTKWRIVAISAILLLITGTIGLVFVIKNTSTATSDESPSQASQEKQQASEQTKPEQKEPETKNTEEIVELVEQSVARIEGQYGGGTGFLIRPAVLVTNRHVIDEEFLELTKIYFPSADSYQKGPYATKLLYIDPEFDIAFLSVETKLPPLQMAKDHQFKRGQEILAIGSPSGLENAVNIGVLSSQKEFDGQQYYQLGISINPGNSGGPVISRNANVIGIATLKSSVQEGIAYCIPCAEIL
ncbi:MAG: trypsin-like peptidase domain-containing protein, partial [Planctomycetaceae bacterium]|nr:trypsin-like peptidase domain-containing protein [Planctomycetaceae bacterium]